MQITLDYGRTGLSVEVPDGPLVKCLQYRHVAPLADPQTELRRLLEAPTGSSSLGRLAQDRQSACILICDITRPVPNKLLLSEILSTLHRSGLRQDQILILVATGLHRASSSDELLEMLGSEIVSNYRIENHDGRNRDQHTYLGDSPRGVPIWIDSRYLQADLKIATGLIEPHLMAGFSGGRKLICPGIAGLDTVRVWHGPAFLEHPKADCGQLDGNPVHEENTWIGRRAGCDFIVNVVIDAQRQPLKIVAGDMEQAFLEGVEFVRQVVTDCVADPVDVVLTSAAGYPLDTTFYQSIKGMTGALPIVKQGGTIIIAAGLSDGIGSPEFEQLCRDFSDLELFRQTILGKDYFVLDQWQLQEMAKVRRQARVLMYSDGLPRETLDELFVESAASVESAVSQALAHYGPQATLAVIPKGPYVLAQVGDS